MKNATAILCVLFLLFVTISTSHSGRTSPSERGGGGLTGDGGSSGTGGAGLPGVPGGSDRSRDPARPSSPSSKVPSKKTLISRISAPKCIKKKSQIKVTGLFLKSGGVSCTVTPKLPLKEITRNEKQLLYQVNTNTADKRYTVKCSNRTTSKRVIARGCSEPVTPTVVQKTPAGDDQVDLKVMLALTGKTKSQAGENQSLKLTIKNDVRSAGAKITHPQRQIYLTRIFLDSANRCRGTQAAQQLLPHTPVQKEMTFTTIPPDGKTQTRMLSIPLPVGLQQGKYYWHAMVDSSNRVKETREDNNLFCLSQAVEIARELPTGETVPYSLDKPFPTDNIPVPAPKPPIIATCDGFVPTIKGDSGDNIINGTTGPDIIHGMGGNDIINGFGGDDIICGGDGYDLIHGGVGDDRLFGNNSVWKSQMANCYGQWNPGTANHDRLLGGPGNDTLDGGPGQDCVFGDTGNDTIIGAEGTDFLIGGAGNDLYRFTNSVPGTANVTEAPNVDTDTFDFSGFPTQDGISVSLNYSASSQAVDGNPNLSIKLSSDTGIENLIGTDHDDMLRGNSRNNLIKGGNSTFISQQTGNNPVCNLGYLKVGDILAGMDGNDVLLGEGGSDTIWGGERSDWQENNVSGSDILDGGEARDCLYGGDGNDQLIGGAGDDWLEGGSGNDTYAFIDGNLGTNWIKEAPSVDTDTLDYSQFTEAQLCVDLRISGPFYCQGSQTRLGLYVPPGTGNLFVTGIENVIGSDAHDHIHGNSRNNFIIGGKGNDFIVGRSGNDTIQGDDGNDTIRGGPGDDQLFGANGNDILTGDFVQSAIFGVTWTDLVNTHLEGVNGFRLKKSSSGDSYDAGAVSVESLPSGDGSVQSTVYQTNTHRMFGLSNGNTDVNYQDVDFGLYLHQTGVIKIYENGSLKLDGPSYQSGDNVSVEVVGGTVYYKQNGNTIYTSAKTPTYPLLVDTALYSTNATLNYVSVSSGFISAGNDLCDGGSGTDSGGSSCETKVSIEIDNPLP